MSFFPDVNPMRDCNWRLKPARVSSTNFGEKICVSTSDDECSRVTSLWPKPGTHEVWPALAQGVAIESSANPYRPNRLLAPLIRWSSRALYWFTFSGNGLTAEKLLGGASP